MAYTKEQCDTDFRDALTKLESLYGIEKLREADETFDVDAVLRYFLKQHPLAEYRTSGERELAIEDCFNLKTAVGTLRKLTQSSQRITKGLRFWRMPHRSYASELFTHWVKALV